MLLIFVRKSVLKYFLILLVFCSGCITSQSLNSIDIGMTKADVIKKLGSPHDRKAQDNTEYLIYYLIPYGELDSKEYFVRLVNGRVESYGRPGDFDSTKIPETKSNVDLTVH